MIACEMADDRIAALGRAPRQGECAFRKFVGMRDIKGGRQRRFFTDPIGPQDLGEFEDFRLIALDLRERDRAVACAEVDAETEPMVHGWLISSCLKALCHIRESGYPNSPLGGQAPWIPAFAGMTAKGGHPSSTSAGAIAGGRSALMRRGSFTHSVFHP